MVQAADDVTRVSVHWGILGVQVFLVLLSPCESPVGRLFAPVPIVVLPYGHFCIDAPLRLDEQLFRSRSVCSVQFVREVVVGALVPVHCRTSEVFRAGRIPVHRSRPLVQTCAVLVVAKNIQVSQSIGLKCRAQMLLNKFRHFVRRVEHTFPIVAVAVGFIFHRKAPQGDVVFLAFLGILDEKLRPRRLHFLQQPPPDPIAVVLHPRRCCPR